MYRAMISDVQRNIISCIGFDDRHSHIVIERICGLTGRHQTQFVHHRFLVIKSQCVRRFVSKLKCVFRSMETGRRQRKTKIDRALAPVTEIARKLYDADSCLSMPLSPGSNEPHVSQGEATRDFAFPFADSTPAHLRNLRIKIITYYIFLCRHFFS